VDSYLEFLKIAERRAIKVTPAHKHAWQSAFTLQRLLKRRQSFRFKYLFACGKIDMATFASLDSIAKRLDEEWTQAEEAALRDRMSAYRNDSRAIEDMQSKWDRTRSTMHTTCWRAIPNIVRLDSPSQKGLGS
jgi:hypothetical protein